MLPHIQSGMKSLETPDLKARMASLGAEIVGLGPGHSSPAISRIEAGRNAG